MRGWQEDDCNSYTGRPWRPGVGVRRGGVWEGGGGSMVQTEHNHTQAYTGELPSQVRQSMFQ